jgi:hypothetical protein
MKRNIVKAVVFEVGFFSGQIDGWKIGSNKSLKRDAAKNRRAP